MKVNKAIKFRIYPTEEQKIYFANAFGCCRKIWNLMLGEIINYYQETGKSCRPSPAKYKDEYPFLRKVDSLALANVWTDINDAFDNYFKHIAKFPKFKSKRKDKKRYTTYNTENNLRIVDNKYIRLPKAGLIKARIHRIPDSTWLLKSATISQSSDNLYYISLLFEFESSVSSKSTIDSVIGLDYKSDGLYMDSNGNVGSNHRYFRESQDKLSKEQRRLSRKVGSKKNETKSHNYLKQLTKVNKIHRHIANQRLDNLHKLSAEITNQYDVICAESLNMRNMSNKKFHNGKSTMDNGYGMFLKFLKYKAEDKGKYFIKVDKFYPSSQLCSCCGYKQKMPLKVRIYNCPSCGTSIDRDLNAAINIKNEGLRLLKEKLE